MASENPRDTGAAPEEIAWRVHPFTENVWRSFLLVAIILVACIGAWLFTGWFSMAALALLFLAISMAPYLFPTRYRMDSEGIEIVFIGVKTIRGWEEYKNFYPHDVGVHLSTFRRPSRLDAFRGNFIRFAPGNREIVLKFLDSHIERKPKDKLKDSISDGKSTETDNAQ